MARPVVLNDTGQIVHKYGDVSRETLERLQIYVDLVLKWQPAQNLIAPSTIADIWTRHVADSLQTQWLDPAARVWVDIGSGGGFPGIVTAILLADEPDAHVHLIESNQRKAAFLRTALRETGSTGTVHPGRIESVAKDWRHGRSMPFRLVPWPLSTCFSACQNRLQRRVRVLFSTKVRIFREKLTKPLTLGTSIW